MSSNSINRGSESSKADRGHFIFRAKILQWTLDLRKILGVTKIFLKSRFVSKGQLISKCPYEKSVSSKIPTKIFLRFLLWKFTTSRLTQKESLCSVCNKIDSVLY